ncbi:hypothetical protein [Fischerella sp. PCC 9605]|uniref:hypothetical protein n=1 Tax=Fischerella sp. PCC 9605 TaxID=1173024 RepID=UPI00047B2915|nr:hypothetical protein [Fischerella sp. PCC 9605]
MASSLAVIGTAVLSNPDKVIDAIKKAREEGEAWVDLIKDAGQGAVDTFRDFQTYFRGERSVPTSSTVVIYRSKGGTSASRGFNTGDAIANFRDIHWQVNRFRWENWNDEVSSIKVAGGIAAAFYEHASYGGARLLVIGSASLEDLANIGWTDQISSCKIIPAHPDAINSLFL